MQHGMSGGTLSPTPPPPPRASLSPDEQAWLASNLCFLTMLGFLIYFNFIQNLVQSPSSAGPVCSQNDTLIIPAVQPLWSCGLEVFGNFSCAGQQQLALLHEPPCWDNG